MSGLPPSASVAQPNGGAKLCAPSALRNLAAITDVVTRHAPVTGRALEIASGTGQHIVALARALPNLTWQPTEIAPERIASINAYGAEADLPNLASAQLLDAAAAGWAGQIGPFDLIYLGNLLHLIPVASAQTLIKEAAVALAPAGCLVLYGPFRRAGMLTSDGDKQFDTELRAADPAIGYKDDSWIKELLTDCGLHSTVIEMPANNLSFVARQETE